MGVEDGGGELLRADFLGRYEHAHPLVIDGKEIDEQLVVGVEGDRIVMEMSNMTTQRVFKIPMDRDDDIQYISDEERGVHMAVVKTGTYEGRKDKEGNLISPLSVPLEKHTITVYKHGAQYDANPVRGWLRMVFLDHWGDPVQEAGIQDDEYREQVATHKQAMDTFVHMTPFNRVVRGSSEVPPIDDNHPIIPDIPADNTKDGPLTDNTKDVDIVPKDGDGGGVLPLAVGGGAALILLLMVK